MRCDRTLVPFLYALHRHEVTQDTAMKTLRQFVTTPPAVPMSTTWYLTDLGEAKGKQELFTRQSPQRLKALREHAMIESAVSSNRIEGVEIDASRVRAVVLGHPTLRDRNEEEIRGYRDALKLIHESGQRLAVSEKTIRRFHRLSRGQIWDAGQHKKKDAAAALCGDVHDRELGKVKLIR